MVGGAPSLADALAVDVVVSVGGTLRQAELSAAGQRAVGSPRAKVEERWRAVADEELMAEAGALAERLAAGPTAALALMKRALDTAETNSLDAQLDLERDLQSEAAANPDFADGLRAFLTKRSPAFAGRR